VSLALGQVVLVLAGYVAGSMPWGYWLVRVLRRDDIRRHGSGNTGATNVWRTYGKRLGLATAVLDLLKGFVPALVARLLYGDGTAVATGAAAMLGHTWPVFLGLGGGKGVATGSGALAAVFPVGMVIATVTWLVTLWLTRYVSVASMVAAVVYPACTVLFHQAWATIVFAVLAGSLVIWRHRGNIQRLRRRTEPRVMSFGRGRPQSSPQ
jgi:glycerol-3-phosphate acyltransferase PlsY